MYFDTKSDDRKCNGGYERLQEPVSPIEGNNANVELKRVVDSSEDKGVDENGEAARETGCTGWCRHYFWEGQTLDTVYIDQLATLPPDAHWTRALLVKYRRIVGLLLPVIFFHALWWPVAIRNNIWSQFSEKYFMSITMIFGSVIAGMTSEGGGAIAFPVMTLVFHIPPEIARDFSFMIQSCGMSAATFTIIFMHVQLEWNSIGFCSFGAIFGVIFGFEVLTPLLSPAQMKFIFVSIWFSFAFALFLLNRYRERSTFLKIPDMNPWKVVVLTITGFVGGIFTSFSGSGLDICSFSVLTLLFRVTEKTATPTSVVLMASNSLVAFYWRGVVQKSIASITWDYFAVCVPVVVIGAPIGSVLGSHFHRLVLASFVYVIDTAALIGAFVIVRPLTPALIGLSVGIIIGGFLCFSIITLFGTKLMEHVRSNEQKKTEISPGYAHALNGID